MPASESDPSADIGPLPNPAGFAPDPTAPSTEPEPSTRVQISDGDSPTPQPDEHEAPGAGIQSLPDLFGYTIESVISVGGMGIVYRAKEHAIDRDVAIKVLKDRFSKDARSVRRFLNEACITGQLEHPAIPPVHRIGALPDGRPFLAMKLIKGDTLASWLAREPANRGRFVVVFAQICQAVAYAHDCRVIHRDLKPSNIMVGAFGEVQVMDWGIAKVLTEGPGPTVEEDERLERRPPQGASTATQTGACWARSRTWPRNRPRARWNRSTNGATCSAWGPCCVRP
jgi:serine/threonine-protein kinase